MIYIAPVLEESGRVRTRRSDGLRRYGKRNLAH